jgi:hypothetical protein
MTAKLLLLLSLLLLFFKFLQAPRAQAILVGIHDDLHLAGMYPHFLTPAVIFTLAGEKPSAGRTALQCSF